MKEYSIVRDLVLVITASIVLGILKLCNVILWAWIWILSPIWITVSIWTISFLIGITSAIIRNLKGPLK